VLAASRAPHGRRLEKAVITIDTTRYSVVVTAFVHRYPSAIAVLDRKPQSDDVSEWCTNENLQAATDFSLREGEAEFLGFHDGPRNMWASDDTRTLVRELAALHVLRYSNAEAPRQGFLARLFGRKSRA